jgi:hypothetical protein
MRVLKRSGWNASSVLVACLVLAGCEAEPSEVSHTPLTSGGAGGGQAHPGSGGTSAQHGASGIGGSPHGGGTGGAGSVGGAAGDVSLGGMGGAGGEAGVGGAGGMGGAGGRPLVNSNCKAEEAFEPLVQRDGEVCYEFLTHNGAGEGDPFIVTGGEAYNQLYYDIPWPADSIATRYGGDYDNIEVLHHWLAFESTRGVEGQVDRNVLGWVAGDEATMIGGWASGGCTVEYPSDMGLELGDPADGKKVMIQWHHYNFTGTDQADASKIQICTVPRSARPKIAGITFLGTEDFQWGMPPGEESKFGGTCLNETNEDITIVQLMPHMHRIGTNMYTEVIRMDGTIEPMFDQPFSNENQINYSLDPFIVMKPGDRIRAECTFFNKTQAAVNFGQSTDAEMCYQFAVAHPIGALNKPGNPSFIGALNTCWGD